MASINKGTVTSTSISVSVTAMTTNYNKRVDFYLQNGIVSSPSGGSRYAQKTIGKDASVSYTYQNLTPGTWYTPYVKVFDTDTGNQISFGSYWISGGVQTSSPSVTPWYWDQQNYTGGASVSLVKMAWQALDQKGYCSNFSYLVWNDLVKKVIEMREGAGKSSWSTSNSDGTKTYLSSNATKMSSTDKNLTAARFNAFRWNIGTVISTGIEDKNVGDFVLASDFINLVNYLNQAINNLT